MGLDIGSYIFSGRCVFGRSQRALQTHGEGQVGLGIGEAWDNCLAIMVMWCTLCAFLCGVDI